MENRAHALAAGLFTLLLGIGVLVAAQWFSRDNYEQVHYTLVSKHSVSGLNVQAAVRLRGVEVGKVESIDFDAEDPGKILIRITIKGGTRITRGTTAQLGTQGITGLAYVMLEDDGKKPDFLPPTDDKDKRIAVQKSFMDELTGSGKDLISQFGQVAQRVNLLLNDPNQAQLLRTLSLLESAAQRITVLAQSLEPGAKAVPALTADARKALQNAATTLESIDVLAREYARRADTLERMAKSAEQLGGASQGVSQSAQSAVGDAAPRINALLEELARNSRNLDRLLSELNEQPAGLVFGRGPARPGPGEPGYTESARSK
jgi:phospholipid/cholesterol/gamma-HCH transport system substrate-binding protein